MKIIFTLSLCIAVSVGRPQYAVPPPPPASYYPEPQASYGAPAYDPPALPAYNPPPPPSYEPELVPKPSAEAVVEEAPPAMPGMPYEFDWSVDDAASKNTFKQEEKSDGFITRGRWEVLLPDGRLQITTYEADENGFRPTVVYQ